MGEKVTLEKLSKKTDNLTQMVLDLTDEIKDVKQKMATRKDINNLQSAVDKNLTILKRLDQERLFTYERIKRLEAEVSRIKTHLGIS